MMSRITLHLKRFAHRNIIVESDVTRRHGPQRRRLPFAACPQALAGHVLAPPRVASPPRWSTSAPTAQSHTTLAADESFALETFCAAPSPPHEYSGLEKYGPALQPAPIDLDVLYTPSTAGDKELAATRGDAWVECVKRDGQLRPSLA